MSYNVYLREHVGRARNHHVIFVQTESNGGGFIFQVARNIQQGIAFDHKRAKPSKESETCLSQEKIGTVTKANFDRIQSIVETLPPPPKQFNGPKRINPNVPLRRCQEWTADAI
ncbi:hypothetical protein BCR34DRAFT_623770 [Clohesyomyces aquaticus]|uniref:Uncharacterized protein n=1 Tax=Clohesyomyces aquaticus TaxID=1231657 RepID=A0A1Y1ZTD2_9PLEO|nr:hypothetical protein BCR34DRAFT_623770 [Clohesyomyces aquaticus]